VSAGVPGAAAGSSATGGPAGVANGVPASTGTRTANGVPEPDACRGDARPDDVRLLRRLLLLDSSKALINY